jgi:hypothetical protein
MKHILASTALLACLATSALAQINLSVGLTYDQTFDSLTRSNTAESWTDNTATASVNTLGASVGLVGWYANYSAGGAPQIAGSAGGLTTARLYSFGSVGSTDRALGSIPGTTPGNVTYGVRFVNDTAYTITGFTMSFDGEQWAQASGASNAPVNNSITPGYAIFSAGAGAVGVTGTYTALPNIFNSPVDGSLGDAGGALDGNLSANRVAGISNSISSLAVLPGQEIWIRFFDGNSTNLDHGLGIDNFSISFTSTAPVPEPASAAVLAGLGALGLVALRRRRAA